jgi:transcriptional regulator with XRE-family HTH domain
VLHGLLLCATAIARYCSFVTTRDEIIGQNLTILRGDISQKELAAKMKTYGWKWSQATVWTVESGERPLRLAEAADIAMILELGARGVESLTRPKGVAMVQTQLRFTAVQYSEMKQAIAEFRDSQMNLAATADDEGITTGLDQLGVRGWLTASPSQAAREVLEDEALEGAVDALRHPDTPPEKMQGEYISQWRETWGEYVEHKETP